MPPTLHWKQLGFCFSEKISQKTASQKPETDVSRLAGSRRAGDGSPLIVFAPDGDSMHWSEPDGGA